MMSQQEITVLEAAIQTGYSLTHLYNLVRMGRLQGAHKSEGEWKVPVSSLREYQARAVAQ